MIIAPAINITVAIRVAPVKPGLILFGLSIADLLIMVPIDTGNCQSHAEIALATFGLATSSGRCRSIQLMYASFGNNLIAAQRTGYMIPLLSFEFSPQHDARYVWA